jgi:hypothetical protein
LNERGSIEALRVLRVEELMTVHGFKRWFPDDRVDHIDKVLFELLRQNRVRRETEEAGEAWYFGGMQRATKILERVTVV